MAPTFLLRQVDRLATRLVISMKYSSQDGRDIPAPEFNQKSQRYLTYGCGFSEVELILKGPDSFRSSFNSYPP
jgi:hypothetical protein